MALAQTGWFERHREWYPLVSRQTHPKSVLFGQTVMAQMLVESVREEKKWKSQRRQGWCWRWAVYCLCFQRTVESTGGQWCLRGSAVTTHPVFQTSLLPPSPFSATSPLYIFSSAVEKKHTHIWSPTPGLVLGKGHNPAGLLLTPSLTLTGYLLCQLQKAWIIQSHSH